jgi:hypothetical protein
MAGTIVGLLISLYALYTYIVGVQLNLPDGSFFIVMGLLAFLLLIAPIAILFALQPITRMEKSFTPGVTKLFWANQRVRYFLFGITLFPPLFILSFIFLPDLLANPLVIIFPFAFGWICDSLRHFLLLSIRMTVPTEIILEFSDTGAKAMQQGQLADYIFWSRTIGSTVAKAIDRHDNSLAIEAIKEQSSLTERFIQTLAVHFIEGDPIEDQANYALISVLQDQEQHFFSGLEMGSDLIAIQTLTCISKTILTLSQRAPVKAQLALHVFSDLIGAAQEEDRPDIAMKGIYCLGQLVKDLSTTVSVETLSDRLVPIIGHMEEITQEMFKRDKEIDLEFLTHPFKLLLSLFDNEKFKDRVEIEPTLKQINKTIADFASLSLIVQKRAKSDPAP